MGTETYDLRQQLSVRSVGDGDTVALMPLDIIPSMMGHLEIILECDGGMTVSTMLNVCNVNEA
jgi:hypothetical protein